MFRLGRPHPGGIELSVLPDLPRDAHELARVWITSERSYVAVARPQEWSPELLGSILVECVHNAAETYAAGGAMDVGQALERLWSGFDEERARLEQPDVSKDLH